MNEIFTIGDFCFRIMCPESFPLPDNFLKFRGGGNAVYTYTFELSDELPEASGTVTLRRNDILVLRNGSLETRYIGVPGLPEPHACYMEVSESEARITVLRHRLRAMTMDTMFVSLLALERRQIGSGGLILHCAYVENRGEAILFSAPSGTGKTTQANLWEQFRSAQTVNGDRALVQKIRGRWYARGWPVCGSSGVCENRDLPVRAVVMLSQAPCDYVQQMSARSAFAQLYSQITVNRWNQADHLRAVELIEQLASEIPVFHLACTMNESAVEVLEAAIG